MVGVRYCFAGLLALLSVVALLVAGCGSGSSPLGDNPLGDKGASAAPVYDLDFDGRTDKPAQAVKLSGVDYTVEPLLTVADEIPLLTGNYPDSKTHNKRTYAFPGIPDGTGIYKEGDCYFIWCNHEISAGNLSSYSDTIGGKINGARVSLIAVDDSFRIIGGRNLIERVFNKGVLIGETKLNGNKTQVTQSGSPLSRLCSSTLTDIYGGDPLYLAGEESSNGRGFVIDTDGDATQIDTVKVAFENMVPISKWNNETVLLVLDDTTDRYLVLYVGDRMGGDLGWDNGTCYVGKVFVNGAPVADSGPCTLNALNTVEWVEVPRTYDFDGAGGNPPQDLYGSTAPFYNWAGNVVKATQFKRPEDGHENPKKAGQVHWVTTGNNSGGSYDPFGRCWELNLGNKPTKPATLRLTSIGDNDYYMNPDNVTTDSFKQFWLQEYPSGTQNLMLAQGRTASIYRSPLGTDTFVRLFEVAQNLPPFSGMGIPNFSQNPWETSGICEIPGVNKGKNAGVIFDTQAHGWSDPDYVEGGQLILAFPKGYKLPDGCECGDDDDKKGGKKGNGKDKKDNDDGKDKKDDDDDDKGGKKDK